MLRLGETSPGLYNRGMEIVRRVQRAYEVADEDGDTRVTITEEGVVKNPIFRFISRFVLGHDATLEAFLRDRTAHLGRAH